MIHYLTFNAVLDLCGYQIGPKSANIVHIGGRGGGIVVIWSMPQHAVHWRKEAVVIVAGLLLVAAPPRGIRQISMRRLPAWTLSPDDDDAPQSAVKKVMFLRQNLEIFSTIQMSHCATLALPKIGTARNLRTGK